MKQLLMTFLAAITLMGSSLSVLCQQQTSSIGENLTLDQAIAMALQNNRSTKNARLEVLKAHPLECRLGERVVREGGDEAQQRRNDQPDRQDDASDHESHHGASPRRSPPGSGDPDRHGLIRRPQITGDRLER